MTLSEYPFLSPGQLLVHLADATAFLVEQHERLGYLQAELVQQETIVFEQSVESSVAAREREAKTHTIQIHAEIMRVEARIRGKMLERDLIVQCLNRD